VPPRTVEQDLAGAAAYRACEPVVREVRYERFEQGAKWGQQDHPDGTGLWVHQAASRAAREECDFAFQAGRGSWRLILAEEVAEAFAETDPAALRTELLQVAAVAVAWVEALDRRTRGTAPESARDRQAVEAEAQR
jgi:hypothetical protein